MSLFKPFWMKNYSLEREEKIKKINDQSILKEIAFTSPNCDFRKTAVEKISDQAILAKVACKDYSDVVRLAAIEKISDQSILASIVLSHASVHDEWPSEFSRIAAIEKISDQTILAKAALEFYYIENVWKAAIDKLSDQSLLAEVIINSQKEEIRKAAIDKLNDQSLLAEVALNEENDSVIKAAVEKINDHDKLAKIALNANEWTARKEAIAKVTRQSILAKVALKDNNWIVREAAVEKITDQKILAEISINDEDKRVREVAKKRKKKLAFSTNEKNEKELEKIAQTKDDIDIRSFAVKSIKDQSIIMRLAKNGHFPDVRKEAIRMLSHENQRIIKEIVKFDKNPGVRSTAKLIEYDEHHKWESLPGCRKLCSVCGLVAYDHNWICTQSAREEYGIDYYECTKCGKKSTTYQGLKAPHCCENGLIIDD